MGFEHRGASFSITEVGFGIWRCEVCVVSPPVQQLHGQHVLQPCWYHTHGAELLGRTEDCFQDTLVVIPTFPQLE